MDVTSAMDFSLSVDGTCTSGSLTGSGSNLELRLSDPSLLGSAGKRRAREGAAWLAGHGIRVSVVTDRWVVTLGEPQVPRWHRLLTGSPHIRLGSVAAAWQLRPSRSSLPPLAPPPTPLPLTPTVLRRPRRPTTTHDSDRAGYPRLVMAPGAPRPGDPPRQVHRLGAVTTIGSDPTCAIRLAGLDPVQAVIRQDDDDEFVLSSRTLNPLTRVSGVPVREAVLRTGSRVDLGPWTLLFAREEYADHGRPFGGRIGGELGRQRPQAPRAAS